MPDLRLTPGSKYRVRSLASQQEVLTTEGTFRGLAAMGSLDALVMEVKEGRKRVTRLIPTHVVVALDVLEAAGVEEQEDEEASMHYT
ncbi:MAG: hypothetical protein ACRELA_06020 [Candidatus Rokuibacteriota bacterium]